MTLIKDLLGGKHPLMLAAAVIAAGEALSLCYLMWTNHKQQLKLLETEAALEKQAKLRADERSARISIQQDKRKEGNKSVLEKGYHYHPIGFVESPFGDRRGTPRQPSLVPAATGKIRFDKNLIQNEHFKELEHFSHVWVVFVFHNNTNTEKASHLAKIKPPRLHGAKVGCLSTRSPHRPNNIGLSVCEVICTGEDFIELRCVDMVNGTPVLDGEYFVYNSTGLFQCDHRLFLFSSTLISLTDISVKPYIPYDVVPSPYVLPMATSADGSALPVRELQVPSWVVEADIPMLPVVIPDSVLQSIDDGLFRLGRKKLVSCNSVQDAVELITQVIHMQASCLGCSFSESWS